MGGGRAGTHTRAEREGLAAWTARVELRGREGGIAGGRGEVRGGARSEARDRGRSEWIASAPPAISDGCRARAARRSPRPEARGAETRSRTRGDDRARDPGSRGDRGTRVLATRPRRDRRATGPGATRAACATVRRAPSSDFSEVPRGPARGLLGRRRARTGGRRRRGGRRRGRQPRTW